MFFNSKYNQNWSLTISLIQLGIFWTNIWLKTESVFEQKGNEFLCLLLTTQINVIFWLSSTLFRLKNLYLEVFFWLRKTLSVKISKLLCFCGNFFLKSYGLCICKINRPGNCSCYVFLYDMEKFWIIRKNVLNKYILSLKWKACRI